MKKALFFVTALSVAVSPIAQLAVSAEDSIYGVPKEDTIKTSIDVVTKWSGGEEDFASHTSSNPLSAVVTNDKETKKFDSKAYIDVSNVAQKWDEYLDAAVAYAKKVENLPGMTDDEIREYAIKTVKFVGSYTLTLTVDGSGSSAESTLKGIENAKLQSDKIDGFEWETEGYDVESMFDFNNQSYMDNSETKKRIYSVEISVKDGVNEQLDAYFKAVNDDKDGKLDNLVLSIADSVVGTTGSTYEIKAEVKGEVTLDLPKEDLKLTIDGAEDAEYVALDSQPTETPQPTKKPGGGSGSSGGGGGTGPIAGGSNTGNGNDVSTPGISNETELKFKDLGSVQWAVPAINTLANLGVINGRTDTIFDPLANVTRAEFTKIVCGAFAIVPIENEAHMFTDVSTSDWFYGYVQAAAANGIVKGVSDTEFNPNATITRQEMATILYRTIVSTGADELLPKGTAITFDDEAEIADYAKDSVAALSSAGVINGVTDTTFVPTATATRAQAAAIIYQYYKAIKMV